MWKFLNRGISTPLAIGIILILVIIVGGFTWWQYAEIRKEESEIPEISVPEEETTGPATIGTQPCLTVEDCESYNCPEVDPEYPECDYVKECEDICKCILFCRP